MRDHDTIDPHEFLASDEAAGGAHEHHVHVTPFWTMFWVFVILLVLTALTVWSSNVHYVWIGNTQINIGATAHILLAMGIATIKAVLVAAYFMHLLYDKKVNTIVVGSTIFALVLFIGLTLIDLGTRPMVTPVEEGEIFDGGDLTLYAGSEVGAYSKGDPGNIVTLAEQAGVAKALNELPPADDHGADDAETEPETEPETDAGAEPAPDGDG